MIDAILERALARVLARQEGIRYDLYRDTEGLWTIGEGHLVSADPHTTEAQARAMLAAGGHPAPWTLEQIEAQARSDIHAAVAQVDHAYPWVDALPPRVKEGVYDMTFQLGIGRFGAFHDMLACLRRGDYQGAKAEGLDSLWHKQTGPRCEEVCAMLGNEGAVE